MIDLEEYDRNLIENENIQPNIIICEVISYLINLI